MEIEEWKPTSPEPHKAPVPRASETGQVIGYCLSGMGVFVVSLALMARHEIGDYLAQRTAKSESAGATPVLASPLSAVRPVAHDVPADVNAGNPVVPHQVNPTPPPHLAPRPFERKKP